MISLSSFSPASVLEISDTISHKNIQLTKVYLAFILLYRIQFDFGRALEDSHIRNVTIHWSLALFSCSFYSLQVS